MRKIFIKVILLLVMMPAICLAQQSRRDSLKTALKTARTDSVRFNLLMNLGWEYSETNRDTALYFHDQAFRLAKKNARMLEQAFALWGKGYELTHLGKFPEALVCSQEGLKLAEDPANEKNCWYGQFDLANVTPHALRIAAIANLHHNLGHLMGATGNIDAQITHYRIVKALASGIGLNWLLGDDNATLGNVYLKLNQLDSALMFEQNAERIMRAPGAYRKYLGYVYGTLGEVYLKKQNAALAIKYFHRAISVHLDQKNFSGVAGGYSDLTDYYIGQKQIDSSLYYATRELDILQFMKSKDLDQAFEQLYQSYKLAGKTDSAYKYQGLALKAKDSVFNATTKSLTDFQKLSFKAQIHAQELEKEKAAIQTKIRTYVLLAGIFILLLLAGIFYRNNRQKQKANVLLSRQKDEIEAQARESQIEAALEKVRSRSLAMHKSDELQEVVAAVFDKLQELKLPFDAAAIIERVEGSKDAIHWVANEQKTYSGRLFVPNSDVIFLSDMWDAIQNGKGFFAKVYSFEEKNEAWKRLFENSDYKYIPEHRKAFILQSRFYGISSAIAKHSIITLTSYTGQVLTEPEVDVLKRMARVFEQAYVRFLDLQKVEEQARESQIEAALERVRSRTMGMQKSDELGEVIQVIFEQFVQLNFHIDAAQFALDYRESNDFNVWAGTSGQTYPSKIFVPYFDHPIFNIPFAAKNNGSDHYVTKLTVSEKNQWWDHFFKNTSPLPDFPRLILDRYYNAPGYYNYGVLMKTVSFSISNYEGYAYTETEQAVVMRFGKVFEQTYTRFKDLEQAEAQAREAQIEAALERVRSRTMAMQKSEELGEVIQVIYDQFVLLNFNINAANFSTDFLAVKDEYNFWVASANLTYPARLYVPIFDHPAFNVLIEAKASGADHAICNLTTDETKQFWGHFFKSAAPLPEYPPEIHDRIYHSPGYYTYTAIMKTVSLSIVNYSGYAYTEPEEAVIMRFGKVFAQTYTRFKDLEQAEEQAREAKIEAALERVRSRTMAMQKSEELREVIQVVYEQFVHLGLDIKSAGFTMDYKESEDWNNWIADAAHSFPNLVHIPYFDHLLWNNYNEARRKGLDAYTLTLTQEQNNSFLEQVSKYIPITEDAMNLVYNAPGYTVSSLLLKNVSLYIDRYSIVPFSNAENAILLRFGKVFEQTYTRFKDLEQAEEQAREAQIETALERVRSRTMGMQKSDELAEVIQVIFEQFVHLGFNINSATFNMDHMADNNFRLWAASSYQRYPSMIFYPYFDHPVFNIAIEAKKNGADHYINNLTAEEKKQFWDHFFKNASPPPQLPPEIHDRIYNSPGYYSYTAIIKTVSLTIVNYSGYAYTETEEAVVRRFGKVFEQTYTRFKDLEQAEEQAREAKIEAALERVRSRTMAMQKSDELADVIQLIFDQFVHLGFNINGAFFNTDHRADNNFRLWIAGSSQSYPSMVFIPYLDHPGFNIPLAARDAGLDHYAINLTFSEKNQLWDHFFKNSSPTPDAPADVLDRFYNSPGYNSYAVLFKTVSLTVTNYQGYVYTEAEEAVVMRFGKVFEQTYTRFKDLEQAEEQAREAQIQLALERIRARTMAMQKSEELKEVIQVVFEQLVHLGIDIFAAGFTMDYRESDDWHIWAADVSNSFPTLMHIPRFDHPYWNSWNDAKRKGLDSFAYTMDFEEKNSFSAQFGKYLPDLSSEVIDFVYNSPGYTVSNVMLKNVSLYVVKFTTEPYSDEDNAVLMRFGKVFEQTYTRFKDLEQAEEQARESQIQLGLERVRARTMAMQKSEELREVIQVVFDQLYQLNFNIDSASFDLNFRESDDMNLWIAVHGAEYASQIYVPFFDHPMFNAYNENKVKDHGSYTISVNFEEKNSFYERFFEYSTGTSDDRKHLVFDGAGYACTFVYLKDIILSVANFAGIPYSDPDNEIIKRFAAVFEQTYTRFNDLKQAEEQAREAKIEAALERVRSKAMAMHSSEDLAATIGAFYHEMVELNSVPIIRCGAGLLNKENYIADIISVSKASDGALVEVRGKMDMAGHPMTKEVYESWLIHKEPRWVLRGNEISAYYQFLRSQLTAPDYPDDAVQYFYYPIFNEGSFYLVTEIELSEEDMQTYRRFVSVLSLTYKRYSDLMQAEAQAREAQIEASLERVRSKAMAMRNSGDLSAAASTVFTELRNLGINPIRSGVGLLTAESRNAKIYSNTSTQEATDLALMGEVALAGHPVFEQQYQSWLNQENYLVALGGKDLASYYKILSAGLNADLGITVKKNQKEYGHWFMFSEGFLYAWSDKEYTDAEMKILERFKNVIELTFRRYIELQKSETQAREAVRQASLDRVRAEIASMRTISDLDRITPLIWNELTILGVPFIRCGVFIMDEPNQVIHTYLSTPDGKAIAAFQLHFGSDTGNGVNQTALRGWREKQVVTLHWTEEEFRNFSHSLVEQGEIASEEGYLTERPPSGLDLHFFPFLQGMLYAGNTEPLSDDDKDLVQSLADAFSTAYARYEDFNRLELAKKEVERTLTDLKAAQTRLIQSEKMASLGELTAGIAHEIQNPLNFVNNFSEVNQEMIDELEEELNAGNIEEALAIAADIKQNEQKINHHGKRADGIVKGMLQHSRTAGGEKLPTNINSVAEEYMRLSYHGLRAKDKGFNAEMIMNFDPNLPKIQAVGQDIGRVLLNLFNNAFYAVNQKKKTAVAGYNPEVSVGTSVENGQVVIKVKDNGVGMQEQVKEKIMQPFFTTKPTGEGTGLGLSLTYDMVVKGHGGTINVNTREGEYTEFIIILPIAL